MKLRETPRALPFKQRVAGSSPARPIVILLSYTSAWSVVRFATDFPTP
jgi:hypothetical protein